MRYYLSCALFVACVDKANADDWLQKYTALCSLVHLEAVQKYPTDGQNNLYLAARDLCVSDEAGASGVIGGANPVEGKPKPTRSPCCQTCYCPFGDSGASINLSDLINTIGEDRFKQAMGIEAPPIQLYYPNLFEGKPDLPMKPFPLFELTPN
jgi:hypothetical protein